MIELLISFASFAAWARIAVTNQHTLSSRKMVTIRGGDLAILVVISRRHDLVFSR